MEHKTKTKSKSGLRIARTALPDLNKTENLSNKRTTDIASVLEESSREINLILTDDGRIKHAGASIKHLLGYEPFRLLGNNIQKIIPVDQWLVFRAALRACENNANDSISIYCQLIDVNDKRNFYSLRLKDCRSHSQVDGYVLQGIEIEKRRRLEEKLRLHNLAIQQIKEAVVIIDPSKKKVLFANQAFYDLSGFTPREILGEGLKIFKSPYSEMLFHDRTAPKEKEKFFKSLRNKTKFEGRVYSMRKDGSVFYNRLTLSPVINSNEDLTHYIVSMKEIRSRKRK